MNNKFKNILNKLIMIIGIGWIIFVILGAIIYSIFNEGLVSTAKSMLFSPGFRGQQYLQSGYD